MSSLSPFVLNIQCSKQLDFRNLGSPGPTRSSRSCRFRIRGSGSICQCMGNGAMHTSSIHAWATAPPSVCAYPCSHKWIMSPVRCEVRARVRPENASGYSAGLAVSWLHNHELCPHLSVCLSFDSSGSRTFFHHTGHRKHTLLGQTGFLKISRTICTIAWLEMHYWSNLIRAWLPSSESFGWIFESEEQQTDRRFGQRAPSEHNTKVHRASESRWLPL